MPKSYATTWYGHGSTAARLENSIKLSFSSVLPYDFSIVTLLARSRPSMWGASFTLLISEDES